MCFIGEKKKKKREREMSKNKIKWSYNPPATRLQFLLNFPRSGADPTTATRRRTN
jgi:hypothetical protein